MEHLTWAAHGSGNWDVVLIAALVISATDALTYRVYRLTKGGPIADVYGGALLAGLLVILALLVAADIGIARWMAFTYGLLFAVIVMPVWTLGVLLPMRPGAIDYAFAASYWLTLVLIVVAAVAI